MTNLERYKDEFVYMLNKNKITLCSFFEILNNYDDCDTCPYGFESCEKEGWCNYRKFIDWLLAEHKEPIKLKKWEYDLLTIFENHTESNKLTLDNAIIISPMLRAGYFKGVPNTSMTFREILKNCEVVE